MSRLPAILTPRDLADHLRVSEATVRINAEKWGGFRVGKQWRFHRDQVLPLVAPKPDTVTPAWQDADDQQSERTNAAPAGGASSGARMAANASSAATTPRTKHSTRRTNSGSAFARDFPEHASIVRSAS